MDYSPFPLVDLSGSPRERGRRHGRAVPDRIKRGIAMYAESLLMNGVDWKQLEQRAEAMVPVVDAFDPAYVQEMRGIAEGSGQPFAGIDTQLRGYVPRRPRIPRDIARLLDRGSGHLNSSAA